MLQLPEPINRESLMAKLFPLSSSERPGFWTDSQGRHGSSLELLARVALFYHRVSNDICFYLSA
jgi:hypothetical protein